ncbi:hypothetical protein STENM223S_11999 [Streptomyces tendae]
MPRCSDHPARGTRAVHHSDRQHASDDDSCETGGHVPKCAAADFSTGSVRGIAWRLPYSRRSTPDDCDCAGCRDPRQSAAVPARPGSPVRRRTAPWPWPPPRPPLWARGTAALPAAAHAPHRPGLPAADEPGTPQGPRAPLHGRDRPARGAPGRGGAGRHHPYRDHRPGQDLGGREGAVQHDRLLVRRLPAGLLGLRVDGLEAARQRMDRKPRHRRRPHHQGGAPARRHPAVPQRLRPREAAPTW